MSGPSAPRNDDRFAIFTAKLRMPAGLICIEQRPGSSGSGSSRIRFRCDTYSYEAQEFAILNWLDGRTVSRFLSCREFAARVPFRHSVLRLSSAIILRSSPSLLRERLKHCRSPWSGHHPSRESREAQRRELPQNWMNCWRFDGAFRSRPAAHVLEREGCWLFCEWYLSWVPCWHCWALGFCPLPFDRFSRSTALPSF